MRQSRALTGQMIRAAQLVLRDGRIPRPIRWGGALGLLPIPGPVDEIVLVVIGAVLWLFYRSQIREAWGVAAGRAPVSSPPESRP